MDPSEESFKILPIINPMNGEDIKVGSKEYKQLVKMYGEPNKIKSPVSGKLISVGKGEYNNLIKQGYTDQELFVQTKRYDINGKKYTEKELIHMIQFYEQHQTSNIENTTKNTTKNTIIPNINLPDDVLNYIFINY